MEEKRTESPNWVSAGRNELTGGEGKTFSLNETAEKYWRPLSGNIGDYFYISEEQNRLRHEYELQSGNPFVCGTTAGIGSLRPYFRRKK